MKITNNFFLFIFILVPVLLITGPALPDISITFCALFFLFNFIFLKKDYNFIKDNFFLVSIVFWFSIIFISFFAFDKVRSFQDSIIFIRLLILPTIGYFLFFNTKEKIKKTIIIIFICVWKKADVTVKGTRNQGTLAEIGLSYGENIGHPSYMTERHQVTYRATAAKETRGNGRPLTRTPA